MGCGLFSRGNIKEKSARKLSDEYTYSIPHPYATLVP